MRLPRSAGLTRSGWPLSLLLLGLGACVETDSKPQTVAFPSAEQMIATMQHVADCESRAANQVDIGRVPISAVAEQIMGMCLPERISARRAFHLRSDDPDLERDDLKRAVDVVEAERRIRPH